MQYISFIQTLFNYDIDMLLLRKGLCFILSTIAEKHILIMFFGNKQR